MRGVNMAIIMLLISQIDIVKPEISLLIFEISLLGCFVGLLERIETVRAPIIAQNPLARHLIAHIEEHLERLRLTQKSKSTFQKNRII